MQIPNQTPQYAAEQFVAVYGRASKDREDRRISTKRQIDLGVELAHREFPGLPVRIYSDNDLTAADESVFRPDYHRLLGDIQAGGCVGLVAHRQSRLSRLDGVMAQLREHLSAAGIERIDTVLHGPIDIRLGKRQVSRLHSFIDVDEVERTKALTREAHAKLAAEGRPAGGRVYGYDRTRDGEDRSALVINQAEAAVVREIAGWLIEGFSLTLIADRLNDRGTPTPRGGRAWSARTVRQVIEKPTIAGKRGHKPKADPTATGYGTLTPGLWEPIIDELVWHKVQRALHNLEVVGAGGRRFKVSRSHRPGGRKWLLTGGLIRCGRCGGRMVVVPRLKGVNAYACLNVGCGKCSVRPAEMVETLVAEAVFEALDEPAMAARLVDNDPRREELLGEIADAQADMTEAATLKGRGDYDAAQRDAQFYPAKARADAARAALAALPQPDVDLPPADQLRDRWEDLTLRQKQTLLAIYLDAVVVEPGRKGRTPADLSAQERIDERLNLIWRV